MKETSNILCLSEVGGIKITVEFKVKIENLLNKKRHIIKKIIIRNDKCVLA